MALTTTTRRIGEVVVVNCSGKLILGEESTSFRLFVKDLLSKSRQIVLDLGDVSQIDSSGLGTLVALHTTARSAGGEIKLANLKRRLDELLQMTRLVTVFEVFNNAEAAAAAFSRPASRSSSAS